MDRNFSYLIERSTARRWTTKLKFKFLLSDGRTRAAEFNVWPSFRRFPEYRTPDAANIVAFLNGYGRTTDTENHRTGNVRVTSACNIFKLNSTE